MAKNDFPELGDLVQHKVTKVKGIVTSVTRHLHGCNTLNYQPQGTTTEGKPHDAMWADENAVAVLKKAVVEPAARVQERARDGATNVVARGPMPDRPRVAGIRR